MCLFQFWFLQSVCLGVGLQGHMVVLFLVFLKNLHTVFHYHRQLANLITQTAALSNSMKLSHGMWGHLRWTCHGGEV